MRFRSVLAVFVSAFASAGLIPSASVQAETLVALMSDKKLRHFSSTAPGNDWIKTVQITGIPASETPAALDFRPAGSLVVITREGSVLRAYDIDPDTGTIVRTGQQLSPTSANAVAFDAFAHEVAGPDLVLATEADTFYRFNYSAGSNGTLANLTLSYDNSSSDGDPIDSRVGFNPSISGLATTNSFPGAQSSVLYGIDSGQNTLVKIEWSTGSMDTVTEIELTSGNDVPVGARSGFDISGVTGTAYLANGVASATNLFTVDLTSGDAQDLGRIGPAVQEAGVTVIGISALPPSQLANLATRSRVGTGEDVMIAGFIATGGASSRIVIRGLGPSLGQAGVSDVLADPVLTIFNGNGEEVASNDNWKSNQQAAIAQTQLAPTNDLEAAFVGTFAPGAYTAVVAGKNSGTGVGLVEIYRLRD